MKSLFLLLLAPVFFISCVSTKKMNSGKSKLNTLDSQLVSYHKDLERLDHARKEKEAKNQLDDTASNRIKKFIDNTAMRIDTIIEKNMVLVNGNEISRRLRIMVVIPSSDAESTGWRRRCSAVERT